MLYPILNRVVAGCDDLSSDQVFNDIVLPASTAAGTPGKAVPVTYNVQNWDFLWLASLAISTGKFDFTIDLTGCGDRSITTDYVRSTLFWGPSAANPTFHPPKALPLSGTIKLSMRDLSGASNTVSLTLKGRRLSPNDQKSRAQYGKGQGLFLLTTTPDGLPINIANGTTSTSIVLDPSANLRIAAIQAEATAQSSPGTTNTLWKGYLNIRDPRFQGAYNQATAYQWAQAWTGTAGYQNSACPPTVPVAGKGSSVNLFYADFSNAAQNLWTTFICDAKTADDPAAWD